MPDDPAPRNTSATTDQSQAATVPSDTSVSIVTAPWRRLMSVARWNGQPAQKMTGVASTSAIHCQPSIMSAGTIETRTTGTERTAATIRRGRTVASSGWFIAMWSCSWPGSSVGTWYPRSWTFAANASGPVTASS